MYERYREDVKFYIVYIREAHPGEPISTSPDLANAGDLIILQAKTEFERTFAAQQMCTHLSIDVPTLVDNLEDTTNRDYSAAPDRLYLIGRDGRVAYRGGRGPVGFDPQGLETAIDGELAQRIYDRSSSRVIQGALESPKLHPHAGGAIGG